MTLAIAPLAILLAAALVTNFGGGVAHRAHAAQINVTATVAGEKHITDICGGGNTTGSMSFASMAASSTTTKSCAVTFGSTNGNTQDLQVNSSTTNTFGWTGFTAPNAACAAAPAAGSSTITMNTTASGSGGSDIAGGTHCTAQTKNMPISPATGNACRETGVTTDVTCTVALTVTTSSSVTSANVAGGGVLTLTLP